MYRLIYPVFMIGGWFYKVLASSSSSSYVYSSFLSGEPYIVRIEHAFVTQRVS